MVQLQRPEEEVKVDSNNWLGVVLIMMESVLSMHLNDAFLEGPSLQLFEKKSKVMITFR